MTSITAVFVRDGAGINVVGTYENVDFSGAYDRVHWDPSIEMHQDGDTRTFLVPKKTPVTADLTPRRRVLRIGREAKP